MYLHEKDKYLIFIGLFLGYVLGISILNWFCSLKFESPVKFPQDEKFDQKKSSRKYLYVGVMTAEKYLRSRALSCNSTWGNHSKIELEFFSQQGSFKTHGLSVVNLPDVDDNAYPPQKKSFKMLQFMCREKIEDFDWFLRADDDAFFQVDKLLLFLNSLDSERLLYLGQPGLGTTEKKGKLKLGNRPYCMGGPGVFFSRALLKKICPYLQSCLEETYSIHEDVEVGRCVTRVADTECSQSSEMRRLFYYNYFEKSGSFTDDLDKHKKYILPSLSLHPIKNSTFMYRMHNYLLIDKSLNIRHKIHKIRQELNGNINNNYYLNNGITWTSFDYKTLVTPYNKAPKRKITPSWNITIQDVVRQAFIILNANSSRRLFEAELVKLKNSYIKIHPKRVDYKLFLHYRIINSGKSISNKRLALNFKRDLQQLEYREIEKDTDNYYSYPIHIFKSIFDKLKLSMNIYNPNMKNCIKRGKHINLILPLAGRFKIFKRFMNNLARKVFICEEKISLYVIYPTLEYDKENSTNKVVQLIQDFQNVFSHHNIKGILKNYYCAIF